MDATDNDTLKQLNATFPIAEDAVELRVDASFSWPEELEGENSSTAWGVRQAFDAASETFAAYRATRAINNKDPRLTAQGALEADAEWAAEKLPQLQKHAQKLKDQAERLDEQIRRTVQEVAAPPEDPAGVAVMQATWAWLRSLPDNDRDLTVERLVREGDMNILTAVTSGPGYLHGVSADTVNHIRTEAARRKDPVRMARIEAVRKGIVAASRAVEGVERFLRHDTGPDGLHSRAALARPGLRRVS
jgi:hypothetical protein